MLSTGSIKASGGTGSLVRDRRGDFSLARRFLRSSLSFREPVKFLPSDQ